MSDKRSNTNLHSPGEESSGRSTPVESEVRRPHVLDVPDKPNSPLHRGTARLFSIDAAAALGAAAIVGTDDDKDPFVTAPTEGPSLNGPPAEGRFDLTELDIETLMKLKVDEIGAKTTFSVEDLNRLDVAKLTDVDVGAPSLDHGERHTKLTDANIEQSVKQAGDSTGDMSVEHLIAMDIQTLADVTVLASLGELADQQIDLTSLSLETLLTADAGPVTSTDDVNTIEVAQLDLDTLTTVDAGTADTSGDAVTSEGGETGGGLEFTGDTSVDTTSTVQVASSDSSFVPASSGSTSPADSGDAAPTAPANASVGAVADADAAANVTSESSVIGATAGVAALATDPDGGDTVTYSLTDDAGGRFAIDTNTGVITVADPLLLDYETTTNHTVTVQATSTDGSTSNAAFIINLSDDTGEFAVTAVSDSNGTGDTVSESATVGAPVNITALATDGDGSDTVTYSLTDDAGGRFAIDANTGVISVADPMLLDFETATNHTVTVQATSTDGSTAVQNFTVNLVDDTGEFSVGAISDNDGAGDVVSESAANGTAVGIAALATDADGSDTVTYSLTNDAGGRFTIDSNTGVISVADFLLIDYETATSHNVTVRATSTDGSTSDQVFAIGISDDTTEFSVSAVSDTDAAADSVGESVANGTVVGVTALATDADGTDTVSYSLTDDAGGRFAINATTGVVTVADASLLDHETATSHNITVRATSTDGSTSDLVFAIGISDDTTEFSVSAVSDTDAAADSVGESVTNGTVVGVTALATDADGTDTVSYSLTDDAGGRFAINATTGVVTVADASLLDHETTTSHNITVRATSTDGSTSDQVFAIGISDDTTEFSVSAVSDTDAAADSVGESVANGTVVGVTAFASDADATDTVSYSLTDDAGGRFAINATTGVVTVADASLLDHETATSHNITVRATSTDGSTSDLVFAIGVSDDTTEFSVTAVSDTDAAADSVGESVANGTAVGVTAFASDADGSDTISYSLTDDAGGRFAINATTGVVTVADASLLDHETATSHNITVRATSTDGSTSDLVFAIGVSDDNTEFSVSAVSDTDAAADSVGEEAANGSVVGITALATDTDGTDSVSYSLTDDAGGRFAINATTGVVTVADASLLDYETTTSHNITIRATSTDGSTSDQVFAIGISDDDTEFSVSAVSDTDAAADSVGESVANGTVVGVTALASDDDDSDAISYSLTDDAGGRFAINATTGVVTVADASLLDHETATSHNITVRATSTDGSTSDQVFAIGISDDNTEFSVGAVSDVDVAVFQNATSESAANGTAVGITASASDADGSDTVTYSLTDDAGGRYQIDANSGVVTVADNSLLDFETATSHNITVQATSTDGSTSAQTFTVNVVDANEAPTDLTLAVNSGISLNTDGGNSAYLHTVNGGAIVGGLSQFTIEMEFSGTNVTGGDVPLFSYHAGGASDEIELGINETGGLYELYIEIGEQAHSVVGYDASVLMDGTDHQISLTWDNAAGDWQIFVDGTLVANGTGIAAGDTIAGGGTIVLGQEQDTLGGGFDPTQVFHGTLYDVRVFNDVRSSTEISDNLFSQVDASEPGLVANWHMDDLSGGVTTDSVGGNDLSVANVTGGGWVASTQTLVAAVPEGAPDGRLVGSVSATDQDAGDTFTYSLTDDAGGRFAIDGATGVITVADGSLLDYETATSHNITVRVTDSGGLTYDEVFAINLADANDAPTDISFVAEPSVAVETGTATFSGLTHYWKLDGDAVDSVGTDNGVISGASTVTGRDGSALSFDEVNDVVTIPDVTMNNEFTVSFQFKVDDNSGSLFQYMYSHGDINSTNSLNIFLNEASHGTDPNILRTVIRDTDDTLDNFALDFDISGIVGDGQWHTYTLTVTSGVGSKVYLDGVEQNSDTRGGDSIDPSGSLYLGGRQDLDPDRYFGGEMDSVQIYDRPLNGTEVSDLHDTTPETIVDGTLVATASTVDPDAGDTFTYTLTNDAGGLFSIDANTGAITANVTGGSAPAAGSAYTVTVETADSGGLTTSKNLTLRFGTSGDDTISGAAGLDVVYGGTGTDTASYTASASAVTVDLSTGTGTGGDADGDMLRGIENVTGSAFDDTLTGDANANVLTGGAGNDTLNGGGGDDTLDGGAGADILDGGAGYDIVDYSSAVSRVDIRLDLNQGFFDDAAGDTYSGIEGAIGGAGGDYIYGQFGSSVDNQFDGGAGDDTLYGFEGNDTLIGGAGADVLDGGAGTDTVSYAVGSGNSVTVNLSTGLGSGNDAQGDTYTDIENVIGSNNDDVLTGDANANVINGGDGNDTIEGLGGGDTLTGGAGNDTFVYVGAGTDGDTITDFTQGDDRIDVSSYGLTDINDLTIADDGFGNAMIFLPSGDDVTLTGVAPVALTDSDFIF